MDAPTLLDTLIMTLVKEAGSDIHIVSGSVPAMRIHGELISIVRLPVITDAQSVSLLHEMINQKQYEKLEKEQQLDFAYTHRDEYRLRGNAFYQRGSIAIVLRLIPKIKTISELMLPDILVEFAHKKQGFFLVVGPVGQGKSATLAAMVNDINTKDRKVIVTIEDPIEYIYEPDQSYIMQREVGFDTPDFAIGLTAAFRQDVDVILIGEMRDIDTMRAAVTAAETGHLVFSTLHTNSASQSIDRIIDSFPAAQQDQIRSQLASSLIGIFSQRLLPASGGGQVPAYELLIATSAVQNLIREKRTYEIDSVIETSSEKGMVSFDRCLADLVNRGMVPLDAAMHAAKNPKLFEQMI
jgi:twitching motility protein PilT